MSVLATRPSPDRLAAKLRAESRPDFLTGADTLARAERGVRIALAETGVNVTPDESDALAQAVTVWALARTGERDDRDRLGVRDGTFTLTHAVRRARTLLRDDREWKDCADRLTSTLRERADAEREDSPLTRKLAQVVTTDPHLLDSPDAEDSPAPADLTAALAREALARMDTAAAIGTVRPATLTAALATLPHRCETCASGVARYVTPDGVRICDSERCAGDGAWRDYAGWSAGQVARVTAALTVALAVARGEDNADAVAALASAEGWTLRTAAERVREGRRVLRADLTPSALATVYSTVGGTLPAGLTPRDLPTPAERADAALLRAALDAVTAALASIGGRTGAKGHGAVSLTPDAREHQDWQNPTVTGAPGSPGQAVVRYMAGVERKADARMAREDRIMRLTAKRESEASD